MKKAILPPASPPPVGPYSIGILTECSKLVFVSGQIPRDPKSGQLLDADIGEMTRNVLDSIAAILEEAGSSLQNVVKVEIFLTDMNDFQTVNAVYAGYFEQPYPARQTVQVVKLPMNSPIEISCIATI